MVDQYREKNEIRERLETNLALYRFPRALAVVHRRRTDVIKQWSMDETQSWFYSRSPSLDRSKALSEEKGRIFAAMRFCAITF